MPESIRLEKNYLTFNQGLNTESSEISFPDGFSTDERNYELLWDGSRRRRKGLALESGGSTKTVLAQSAGQNYVWKNVGGDPTKTFIVHKLGKYLYFSDDAETISTTFHADIIDLSGYALTGSTPTPATNSSQFTSGRGYLLVSSSSHFPLCIEYKSTTDTFEVSIVNPRVRDYSDQEDGITPIQYPTSLTDEHFYNLISRGWTEALIDTYYTDTGNTQYPNKSVPWHKGYRRQIDASYNDDDGIKTFDHARYTGEPPSSSSAPIGSVFVNPLDSRYGLTPTSTVVDISAISINTSTWVATITTGSAHGLSSGTDIRVQDTASMIVDAYGSNVLWPWDGVYETQSGTTGSTVVLNFTQPGAFTSMDDEDAQKGTIASGTLLTREDGVLSAVGPSACVFHDGRLFLAGLEQPQWADFVFFSQIPDSKNKFSKCYQVADPTDPENNQLVDTDGGYFVIQGIQGVKRMLSMRSSLLVFAENGVWEVGGGQRGFFTPSGYSVRKITDVGCNSPLSPIVVENNVFYSGPDGIYGITPNQYTGILEAQSATKPVIQTKWNNIPDAEQQYVESAYDNAKQRVFFLYGKNSETGAWSESNERFYNQILILDTSIPAWYYYSYNTAADTGIVSMYAITSTDGSDQANKIKFNCINGTFGDMDVCDHDQTDYVDFDGSESPLPYVVTGWDNVGDFQRRRQAPVVTVYSKRTETGYTDTGSGWSGDNESSTKMSAYWDWTELTGTDNDVDISGKVGDQQQVYRHTRAFTPDAAGDYTDGYPVVVTRNKVRGRGRVLQLRFDGAATKDSHILGFTVNYRAQRSY